jgi:hypothetical protein
MIKNWGHYLERKYYFKFFSRHKAAFEGQALARLKFQHKKKSD